MSIQKKELFKEIKDLLSTKYKGKSINVHRDYPKNLLSWSDNKVINLIKEISFDNYFTLNKNIRCYLEHEWGLPLISREKYNRFDKKEEYNFKLLEVGDGETLEIYEGILINFYYSQGLNYSFFLESDLEEKSKDYLAKFNKEKKKEKKINIEKHINEKLKELELLIGTFGVILSVETINNITRKHKLSIDDKVNVIDPNAEYTRHIVGKIMKIKSDRRGENYTRYKVRFERKPYSIFREHWYYRFQLKKVDYDG